MDGRRKQGTLIYDHDADRMDVRFGVEEYYGGLHCGECFDVLIGNHRIKDEKWI